MKTGLKIGLGIAAVAAAFLAWKKLNGKKLSTSNAMLSPFEKMAKDVLDPNTLIGKGQRDYLKSISVTESEDSLLSLVSYAKANPTNDWHIAYNKKASWAPNEIVSLSGLGLPMSASSYLLR